MPLELNLSMKFRIATALVALLDQVLCGMTLRPTNLSWAATNASVFKSEADSKWTSWGTKEKENIE